jgi:hypothetical protein
MAVYETGPGLGSSNPEEMETDLQGSYAPAGGPFLKLGGAGAQVTLCSPLEVAEEKRLSMSALGLSLPNADEATPRPSTPSPSDKTSAGSVTEWGFPWMQRGASETTLLPGYQIRAKLHDICEKYTQKR